MHPHPTPCRTALVVLVLSAAIGAAVVGQAPQAALPADIIARVRSQFAPDTRIAVFDVRAETRDNAVELVGDVEQTAAKEALLKAFRDAGFANVVDRVVVLPDPSMAERPLGIVTVSVAVMKTRPSHASELGNQLILGMVVRLLKSEGGWHFVQSLDDRYLGWMEPGHLALVTREQADEAARTQRVIVTSLYAFVRGEPSSNGATVCDLVAGNILTATGRGSGWVAVRLPDGRTGFVAESDAADYQTWKASRSVTPEAIEQTARRFMGVPYLWGGTSAKGFDCSGYLKTVFRLNGLELQRDTDQQANEGIAVPMDNDLAEVRKGDVLFFGPRAGVTRITHTGIYLGRKLFIHCAGMVKLNSLDPASPVYSENLLKRLVKVRRYATP